MKLYHGTSYLAFLSIMKKGFDSVKTIWTVSDSRLTYLAADNEYDEQAGFEFAHNAAIIAAAMINQMDDRLVVFEFDFPDQVMDDYVTEDSSCENMYDCYEINSEDLNELIRSGQVSVTIHVLQNAYNPNLRIFCIPISNEYLSPLNDPVLERAVRVLNDTEIFLDEIYEYDADIVYSKEDLQMTAWMKAA